MRRENCGLPADYFRARLKAGGCHVLIDGLDETPDEPSRERLAKLIREAAAAFDGCRFVVTSRPEGKIPIPDFEEVLIGDLEPQAIRAFLAKLARQLYPEDETRERTFRQDLEAAVISLATSDGNYVGESERASPLGGKIFLDLSLGTHFQCVPSAATL